MADLQRGGALMIMGKARLILSVTEKHVLLKDYKKLSLYHAKQYPYSPPAGECPEREMAKQPTQARLI